MMGWVMPPMLDWPVTEEISIVRCRETLAVGVDGWRSLNFDADIRVLELGVDQWVNAHAADAGLERTGGNRIPFADLGRRLLPIDRANLRILQQLGVAVAK